MATKQISEQAQAIRDLKALGIKPGTTVYTLLKHHSVSSMSTYLDLYIIKKNEPLRITWSAAKVLGYTYDRKYDGLKIEGYGMDMGFAVVYDLGRVLFPKGFIPAKAGHNRGRNGTPAEERDPDGGYALTHKWIG